ncbi:hypothetical protein [Lentzea sp. E54]|uniref:hypothetical protein n=1 Tax=Lentzea xerophila TaxID=3435883 RepID=UPI003DA42C8A
MFAEVIGRDEHKDFGCDKCVAVDRAAYFARASAEPADQESLRALAIVFMRAVSRNVVVTGVMVFVV